MDVPDHVTRLELRPADVWTKCRNKTVLSDTGVSVEERETESQRSRYFTSRDSEKGR